MSRRYIDDKTNFYPGVSQDEDGDRRVMDCSKLEEMAEMGFSKEEIDIFRKKGMCMCVCFGLYGVVAVRSNCLLFNGRMLKDRSALKYFLHGEAHML